MKSYERSKEVKLPVFSVWRGEHGLDNLTLGLTVVQSSPDWEFHCGFETTIHAWGAVYDTDARLSQRVCRFWRISQVYPSLARGTQVRPSRMLSDRRLRTHVPQASSDTASSMR